MSGRRFALALLAALLLAGCDTRKEATFQGWVEAELIFVGPDETGRVEMLTVREGDQVERGGENGRAPFVPARRTRPPPPSASAGAPGAAPSRTAEVVDHVVLPK